MTTKADGIWANMTECIYCHGEIAVSYTEVTNGSEYTTEVPVPAMDDDEAWAELARFHRRNCEWIATRAHRLDA